MRYFVLIFFILFIIFEIDRCDIINPREQIPSYIHIDSFTLTGNYDSVGSLSHKITDAWVTVDNDYIGTFELPVTLPVLKAGPHRVWLRAGVYENGISLTRVPYSFYNYYYKDTILTEKKAITISPTVRCLTQQVSYLFKEDFESGKYAFAISSQSLVKMTITNKSNPGEVFEGNHSMKAVLDTANNFFEMITPYSAVYTLSRTKASFMELNYKSDISFDVGYISIDPSTGDENQHVVVTLNPAATWQKIYVDFGMEVTYEQSQNVFQIFIGSYKSDLTPTSTIFLDNIKLIAFE